MDEVQKVGNWKSMQFLFPCRMYCLSGMHVAYGACSVDDIYKRGSISVLILFHGAR
jgi:hypothetical protein